MRNVTADKDRLQYMRPVAPLSVIATQALGPHIGDQHWWSFADEWRPAVGPIEAHHADDSDLSVVLRQNLNIVEEMPRGRVAAPLAPSVIGTNLPMPLEPVVAYGKDAVPKVIFVRIAAAIEIDLEPVVRHQAVERVPKCHVIGVGHSVCGPSADDEGCPSLFRAS